jgi:folate-binding protein YgfZ
MNTKQQTINIPNQVRPPESFIDQNVAWHYGDPLREQKYLTQFETSVDISNRGVIKITGKDRKTFLHSLSSQHIEKLKEKESTVSLLLSPNGHIEHELHVINNPEEIYLIVENSSLNSILEFLQKMIFLSQVEITDETNELATIFESKREIHDIYPTWLTPLNYLGEPIKDAGTSAGGDPNKYVPNRPGKFSGREILIPRSELENYLLNAKYLAGSWALEALRIAAGVPRVIIDADHRTIPHEIGFIGNAVHLEKGCYKGQETVARVHNLGKPPRKLVLLHLDGSVNRLPKLNSPVIVDGQEVGFVGSSAQHFELGPIALAIVKAKTQVLLNIAVDEIPATMQDIVVAQ